MEYDAEIMLAFLEEIEGYLPQYRAHLTKLEVKSKDREALDECYRLSHTIKGTSAMMGLAEISQQGQAMEQALLPVVEKKTNYTPEIGVLLRDRVNRVDQMLQEVRLRYEPGAVATAEATPVVEAAPLPPAFNPPQLEAESNAKPKATGFDLDFNFNEDLATLPGFEVEPAAPAPTPKPAPFRPTQPPPAFTPPPANGGNRFSLDIFDQEPDFMQGAAPAPFASSASEPKDDFAIPEFSNPAMLDFMLAQEKINFDKFEPQLDDTTHRATDLANAELTNFEMPDWIAQAQPEVAESGPPLFASPETSPHSSSPAEDTFQDVRTFSLEDILAAESFDDAEARQELKSISETPDLQAPGEISFPANLSPFESQPLPEQVPTNEVNLLPSFGVGGASGIDDLDFDDEDFSAPHYRGAPGGLPPFHADGPDDFADAAELLAQFDNDPGMLLPPEADLITPRPQAPDFSQAIPEPELFSTPALPVEDALTFQPPANSTLPEARLPEFQLDNFSPPSTNGKSQEAVPDLPEFNFDFFASDMASGPVSSPEFIEDEPAEISSALIDDIPTVPSFSVAKAEEEAAFLTGLEAEETTLPDINFEAEASPEAAFALPEEVPQEFSSEMPAEDEEAFALPLVEESSFELPSGEITLDDEFLASLTPEERAALAEMQSAEGNSDAGDEVVIDFDMGALWLAEAQGEIDRLKELIGDFDSSEDQAADARKIQDISTRLRKGAEMMDLEPIARQLGVLETAAEAVMEGELKDYMSGGDIFSYELAALLVMLQPYEEGARDYILNVEAEQAAAEAAKAAATAAPPAAQSPSEAATPVEAEKLEPAVAVEAAPQAVQYASPPVGVEVDEELAKVFATEAEEHIQNLDTRLAQLERSPNNRELLREIRRTAHTLKGSAAMVGFNIISQTAHLMEDLLDRLFDGSMEVTREVIELLFATFNTVDTMVRGLNSSRPEDPEKLEALRPRYAALLSGQEVEEQGQGGIIIFEKKPRVAPAAIRASVPQTFEAPAPRAIGDEDIAAMEAQQAAQEQAELASGTATVPAIAAQVPASAATPEADVGVRVPIKRLDGMMNQVGELVINRTVMERRNEILAHTVEELALSIKRLQRVSRELETRYEVELLKNQAAPLMSATAATPYRAGSRPGLNGDEFSYNGERASVAANHEFDTLEMDQYSEFHTLSREMSETVADLATAQRELDLLRSDLENVTIQQSRITDDLQEKLVKVRLVPISNMTPRLYRTVRTLAASQKKEIAFVVSGENTQVDKTIFEEIGDPLLHIIRNAVDHGIEPPAERLRQGKPEKGTITFAARNEGSQVVIEVRDDGTGLILEDLRRKGVERGFIRPEAQPSREELYDLIFLPGFSTSITISEISGRGVGMDVVRANVLKLKGSIEIQSEEGQGTAFIIRLPTTLAITKAMLVRAQGYSYAIPMNVIELTTRFEAGLVDDYGSRAFYRVGDDDKLPLLELGQILRLPTHAQRPIDPDDETGPGGTRREQPLLIVTGPERVVLKVDNLLGQQEVVVKNLGTHLKYVPGVIGATILGSGEVILILNVYDLVSQALGKRSRSGPTVSGSRAGWLRVRDELRSRQGVTTGSLGKSRSSAPVPRRTPLVQVVDDSLSMRKVLSSALEKAGYRVRTSKDGQEALETIQQNAPDLIIMDIEMPRMDGYELTALLKGREAYYNIPIVMLTSRAGVKHRQKAEEVGADGFLVKPYKEEELLQIVATLLEQAVQVE